MSRDVVVQLRSYLETVERDAPPVTVDELMRVRGGFGESASESAAEPEADGSGGDGLTVEWLWPTEEPATPDRPQRKSRRVLACTAAAAVALIIVLVLTVTDDASEENIFTDGIQQPEPPKPDLVSPPDVADPAVAPGVVDSLGYRWSRVPHDEAVFGGEGMQYMDDVTAGGPGLVAVGGEITVWDGEDYREGVAAVWTSVDGLTWSRVPHDEAVFGGDGNISMHTVIAGGPGLVAIGEMDGSNGDDGPTVIWISVDGITWTRHEDTFNDVAGPLDGPGPAPGLVVVGEDEDGAAVWTSADGITWSRVPHDEEVFGHRIGQGNGMVAVTVGGPGFVAVGSDGVWSDNPTGEGHAVVWTSVDGLTWSRVPHDEAVFGGVGDQGMFDVAVGGPGLVAVGENAQGAPIWTSVDGLTWTQVPNDDEGFGGPNKTAARVDYVEGARVYEVIAGELGLLAFGENEQGDMVWTSVDGITWTRHEAFLEGETRTIAGGPGLVAVGTDRDDAVVWVATPEN